MLKTSDFFELFVRLKQPAYLYVIQALPDGTTAVLFPDKGDRLLTAGREHRIPDAADEWFQVDPYDDEENLYILMSRAPVVGASALISARAHPASITGSKRDDPPPHSAVKHDQRAVDPGSAGPRRQDRVLSTTTRRVIRVKRPDSRPTVIDSADQSGDSILVVRLFFRHT